MPDGKPAGVRCVQLTVDYRCAIFSSPLRPSCCGGLQPAPEMCGANREQAMTWLTQLDLETRVQAVFTT